MEGEKLKSKSKPAKRGRPKKDITKSDVVSKVVKSHKVETIRPQKPKVVEPQKISEVVVGASNIEIKHPTMSDPILIKRGRGRPARISSTPGEKNSKITTDQTVLMEDYILPTILRKKRVFRFDKRLFHQFAKKYDGDIVIMSYVYDRLMWMFINDKIKIPSINETYYHEWCKMTPPIEPVTEKEISSDNAFMRGIPIQYKYSLLIDEDMFWRFEKSCKRYPQFISNELLKQMLNENIYIDTSKYKEWCTI